MSTKQAPQQQKGESSANQDKKPSSALGRFWAAIKNGLKSIWASILGLFGKSKTTPKPEIEQASQPQEEKPDETAKKTALTQEPQTQPVAAQPTSTSTNPMRPYYPTTTPIEETEEQTRRKKAIAEANEYLSPKYRYGTQKLSDEMIGVLKELVQKIERAGETPENIKQWTETLLKKNANVKQLIEKRAQEQDQQRQLDSANERTEEAARRALSNAIEKSEAPIKTAQDYRKDDKLSVEIKGKMGVLIGQITNRDEKDAQKIIKWTEELRQENEKASQETTLRRRAETDKEIEQLLENEKRRKEADAAERLQRMAQWKAQQSSALAAEPSSPTSTATTTSSATAGQSITISDTELEEANFVLKEASRLQALPILTNVDNPPILKSLQQYGSALQKDINAPNKTADMIKEIKRNVGMLVTWIRKAEIYIMEHQRDEAGRILSVANKINAQQLSKIGQDTLEGVKKVIKSPDSATKNELLLAAKTQMACTKILIQEDAAHLPGYERSDLEQRLTYFENPSCSSNSDISRLVYNIQQLYEKTEKSKKTITTQKDLKQRALAAIKKAEDFLKENKAHLLSDDIQKFINYINSDCNQSEYVGYSNASQTETWIKRIDEEITKAEPSVNKQKDLKQRALAAIKKAEDFLKEHQAYLLSSDDIQKFINYINSDCNQSNYVGYNNFSQTETWIKRIEEEIQKLEPSTNQQKELKQRIKIASDAANSQKSSLPACQQMDIDTYMGRLEPYGPTKGYIRSLDISYVERNLSNLEKLLNLPEPDKTTRPRL